MTDSSLTALERLERCGSLEDLVAEFGCDTASPFESPVFARLYDALLSDDRAAMISGVADDFCAAMGTPKPGSRFLEVGCGTGRVLLSIADRYPRLNCSFIGVDPSPEMISIAEENAAKCAQSSRVRFVRGAVGDASVFEQVKDADFLIIRNTVSWMADAESDIRAALRCLRPGGTVLIRELRRDADFALIKARIRNCLSFQAQGLTLAYPPSAMIAAYRFAPTRGQLAAIFERCGVTVVTSRPGERDDIISEPWGVDMLLGGFKKV